MECEAIKTKFGGSMLYVASEKMLYVKESDRNGVETYVCYQTVLTHKKKKNSSNHCKCTSSVRLLSNGKCERMNTYIPHTDHPTHEVIAADKRRMQNIKEQCIYLKTNFPEDAHKVPNNRIFHREMSKLVLQLCRVYVFIVLSNCIQCKRIMLSNFGLHTLVYMCFPEKKQRGTIV